MVYIAVHDGKISKGQRIRTYHTDCEYEVLVVGIMNPNMHEVEVSSFVHGFKYFVIFISPLFVLKRYYSVYMLVK